ncbi:MAG: hypothetical protein FWG43_02605 [Clostridiales bacterium]|nr:hypothetical protein [Clostridiales bacterium]
MKKIFCLCVTLTLLAALTVACDSSHDSFQPITPEDDISDAEYMSDIPYSTFHYNSNDELYRGLRDFDTEIFQYIRSTEDRYMEDTRRKTRVSQGEQENGIFGNMRKKLLAEETIMAPYYQGREMVYWNREGVSNITLFVSDSFRKPSILYHGKFDIVNIGNTNINFYVKYYDEALLEEANEKGASWLINQLDPTAVNPHNYRDHYSDNTTVYEQEIQLGDRYVTAMIIDHSQGAMGPALIIYFVYDDILVCVDCHPNALETILPDITFCEVSLPTNRPLRDRPGREGSRYSTIEYEIEMEEEEAQQELLEEDAAQQELLDEEAVE